MSQSSTPHRPKYYGSSLLLDEAIEIIRARIDPLREQETVLLTEAAGRILGESVVAHAPVPAEPRSAMDGYALRADDLPRMRQSGLPVCGTAHAGHPYRGYVREGCCIRIMTGAVLPDGTDTVVLQEDTQPVDDGIRLIEGGYQRGKNVRQPGEDIAMGQILFEAGRRLRAADIGVLASLGRVHVQVQRRLRVALFTTGDELKPVGSVLASGQIFDSNRYTLTALLARDGCELIDLGIVPDDLAQTRQALRTAASVADIALSTAGVSVGDADLVKEAVGSLGEVELWGVALKMGRPLVFGHLGQCWFFGLAGNPVSAMINYLEIVRPIILHLAGAGQIRAFRYQATLGEALTMNAYREEYRRAVLRVDPDGIQRVYSVSQQGSAVLTSMSRADCLLVVPRGEGVMDRGSPVWIEPVDF
ncbi:hypothetical protein A9404_01000 [Halothiobacillus diazotrophicus]|uniref:Molybdopterin molybdenumtransferase n=1 Tax=Halothiobacillus diazotrophicus TaxID=1860122 RepID=A0A191ZE45_9GAMM|nr:gephyrin-like molybdotransferase Glp [Halothiobacillus diazotrophicus]ANJ66139.1 hypothetical protein A9404_01000 [Halothiobacillus diazotrophicus]